MLELYKVDICLTQYIYKEKPDPQFNIFIEDTFAAFSAIWARYGLSIAKVIDEFNNYGASFINFLLCCEMTK